MAFQDSNPERRNLTTMSLFIILYYLAGGEFVGTSVRLQVVNVNFSKPEILVYFTWGLLIWFCYRYWVVHQRNWRKDYCREMVGAPRIFYYKHLKNRFGLSDDYSQSLHADRHHLVLNTQGSEKLVFLHVYKQLSGGQERESLDIERFADKLILLICGVYILFTMPTLTSYFVPYFLFVIAIIFGVFNSF